VLLGMRRGLLRRMRCFDLGCDGGCVGTRYVFFLVFNVLVVGLFDILMPDSLICYKFKLIVFTEVWLPTY
jgi:hypothetical protein